MRIHREGIPSLVIALLIALFLSLLTSYLLPKLWFINVIWWGGFLFILQFFRNPKRSIQPLNEQLFYSPADGKVVVIEEAFESEYFKDKRLLISIFMSPLDVHANRIPISGKILYSTHQPGQYLPAFNPKSSELNERHSIVLANQQHAFLIRQIAGIMARRICNYCQAGQSVVQGAELGFIKFGSRVDIFFPLGTSIRVKIGDQVQGNVDVLAEL